MIFVDDIVLLDESRAGVGRKLEVWRETLESKGFKLGRTKTEYVEFKFRLVEESTEDFCFDGDIVTRKEDFRYLGSVLQSDGGIDEDIKHRIQKGLQKWRGVSGVLCDRRVPL